MKAIIQTKYGPPDVLQMKEVEKPVPRSHEVLVKVHAASVNRTDCANLRAKPFFMRLVIGLLRPRKHTPGTEFSGEIEATGIDVSTFKAGDKVFGFDDEGAMAHAQYLTIHENKVAHLPTGVSFRQGAVSSEGAHYARNFLNKVKLRPGQKVLVNGATGAIGSAAVQLLKHEGIHVSAVCNTKNIDLVKTLGAEKIFDYQQEDFTRDNSQYDFVFDTVGKSSFFQVSASTQSRRGLYLFRPGLPMAEYLPAPGYAPHQTSNWTQ